jgi:hypothetical protein
VRDEQGTCFPGFFEGAVEFPPTYRYLRGERTYSEEVWCGVVGYVCVCVCCLCGSVCVYLSMHFVVVFLCDYVCVSLSLSLS